MKNKDLQFSSSVEGTLENEAVTKSFPASKPKPRLWDNSHAMRNLEISPQHSRLVESFQVERSDFNAVNPYLPANLKKNIATTVENSITQTQNPTLEQSVETSMEKLGSHKFSEQTLKALQNSSARALITYLNQPDENVTKISKLKSKLMLGNNNSQHQSRAQSSSTLFIPKMIKEAKGHKETKSTTKFYSFKQQKESTNSGGDGVNITRQYWPGIGSNKPSIASVTADIMATRIAQDSKRKSPDEKNFELPITKVIEREPQKRSIQSQSQVHRFSKGQGLIQQQQYRITPNVSLKSRFTSNKTQGNFYQMSTKKLKNVQRYSKSRGKPIAPVSKPASQQSQHSSKKGLIQSMDSNTTMGIITIANQGVERASSAIGSASKNKPESTKVSGSQEYGTTMQNFGKEADQVILEQSSDSRIIDHSSLISSSQRQHREDTKHDKNKTVVVHSGQDIINQVKSETAVKFNQVISFRDSELDFHQGKQVGSILEHNPYYQTDQTNLSYSKESDSKRSDNPYGASAPDLKTRKQGSEIVINQNNSALNDYKPHVKFAETQSQLRPRKASTFLSKEIRLPTENASADPSTLVTSSPIKDFASIMKARRMSKSTLYFHRQRRTSVLKASDITRHSYGKITNKPDRTRQSLHPSGGSSMAELVKQNSSLEFRPKSMSVKQQMDYLTNESAVSMIKKAQQNVEKEQKRLLAQKKRIGDQISESVKELKRAGTAIPMSLAERIPTLNSDGSFIKDPQQDPSRGGAVSTMNKVTVHEDNALIISAEGEPELPASVKKIEKIKQKQTIARMTKNQNIHVNQFMSRFVDPSDEIELLFQSENSKFFQDVQASTKGLAAQLAAAHSKTASHKVLNRNKSKTLRKGTSVVFPTTDEEKKQQALMKENQALGMSEEANHASTYLLVQKKKMSKLKVEIQNMMGSANTGEDSSAQYRAFNIADESIHKVSGKIVFGDSDYSIFGRITIENRVAPFEMSIQKSPSLTLRQMQVVYSSDPSFKNVTWTQTHQIDNFTTQYSFQKIPIDFDIGKAKALYFAFQIIESEQDEDYFLKKQASERDGQEEDYVKFFINFGLHNYNQKIKKKIQMKNNKERLKRLEEKQENLGKKKKGRSEKGTPKGSVRSRSHKGSHSLVGSPSVRTADRMSEKTPKGVYISDEEGAGFRDNIDGFASAAEDALGPRTIRPPGVPAPEEIDSIIHMGTMDDYKASLKDIIKNTEKSNKVMANYQFLLQEKRELVKSRGDFIRKNASQAKHQFQRTFNISPTNPTPGFGGEPISIQFPQGSNTNYDIIPPNKQSSNFELKLQKHASQDSQYLSVQSSIQNHSVHQQQRPMTTYGLQTGANSLNQQPRVRSLAVHQQQGMISSRGVRPGSSQKQQQDTQMMIKTYLKQKMQKRVDDSLKQVRLKQERKNHQMQQVHQRNEELEAAEREKKIYLVVKRDIIKKEREDYEINLKNQIIRKCRVANWLQSIVSLKVAVNVSQMVTKRREEIILKHKRIWAAYKLTSSWRLQLKRFQAQHEKAVRDFDYGGSSHTYGMTSRRTYLGDDDDGEPPFLKHSSTKTGENSFRMKEVLPSNYRRLTSKRKISEKDKTLDKFYKDIVYIRRRQSIRQVFSLVVPMKTQSKRLQKEAMRQVEMFLRDTGEIHARYAHFQAYIKQILKIQSRLRHTLSQRRQDMSELMAMFEQERQVMIKYFMNVKKRHREDFNEDIKKAIINLQSTKIMVTLSNYMDACRTIQREHTEAYREKMRKGIKFSKEDLLRQTVLMRKATMSRTRHRNQDLQSENSFAESSGEDWDFDIIFKVNRFEQIRLTPDFNIKEKLFERIKKYLNKNFPKHNEESMKAIEQIKKYREDGINNITYQQTFVFMPTRPLMHIIIFKAALP